MNFSIKYWPTHERPRERLIQQGAESLSDAELLAIFLRSGSRQYSAVELARLLLQHYGDLHRIFQADLNSLSAFNGIGSSKYAQLMAVKELAKRYMAQKSEHEAHTLRCSERLGDYLKFELLGETREVFGVLCLDGELRKLRFEKLFFGSINQCTISINEILRFAIQQHATFIVIAHNHPFAAAQPSEQDLAITAQIAHACRLVEIELIDHWIISPSGSFSFAEQQLMNHPPST